MNKRARRAYLKRRVYKRRAMKRERQERKRALSRMVTAATQGGQNDATYVAFAAE